MFSSITNAFAHLFLVEGAGSKEASRKIRDASFDPGKYALANARKMNLTS
jgi:hypothetical protein